MIETLTDLRKVKVGDMVSLTDEQTIKDLMDSKAENPMNGLHMEVVRVRKITEQNLLCRWLLCDLQAANHSDLTLVVKIVGKETDVRIYYRPDDVPIATRGDLIKQDIRWLFQPPENPKKYEPADLAYTKTVEQEAEEGPAVYEQKVGELYGECVETPRPEGVPQPIFATVVELATEAKVQNPELLIVEIGGIDAAGERIPDGGVVTFLQGGNINSNDVSLIAR